MARTYQPTLRRLLHVVQIFIGNYQPQLEAGMTAPQVTALLAFITCLINLVSALGEEPTNP